MRARKLEAVGKFLDRAVNLAFTTERSEIYTRSIHAFLTENGILKEGIVLTRADIFKLLEENDDPRTYDLQFVESIKHQKSPEGKDIYVIEIDDTAYSNGQLDTLGQCIPDEESTSIFIVTNLIQRARQAIMDHELYHADHYGKEFTWIKKIPAKIRYSLILWKLKRLLGLENLPTWHEITTIWYANITKDLLGTFLVLVEQSRKRRRVHSRKFIRFYSRIKNAIETRYWTWVAKKSIEEATPTPPSPSESQSPSPDLPDHEILS